MSEEMLVNQCSPTMAGIKTGNLFSCSENSKAELNRSLRHFNESLVPKGVRLLPLKHENGRALIYMYRPDKLKTDLKNGLAAKILRQKSYPSDNCEKCIAELIKRLRTQKEFPHEIGLFLGYPAEDVDGFIKQKAKNAKCVGAWKVYGDEEKAKIKFELYKKCTGVYKNAYKKFNSFDRLVVSFQK